MYRTDDGTLHLGQIIGTTIGSINENNTLYYILVPQAFVLQAWKRAHSVQGLPPEDLASRLPLLHWANKLNLWSLRQKLWQPQAI